MSYLVLKRWFRRLAPAACAALGVALVGSSGCEAVVSGAIPSFRCDPSFDAGVCPEGQYCLGSTCVPNSTRGDFPDSGTGTGTGTGTDTDAGTVSCGPHVCSLGQVCAPKTEQCIAASAACTIGSCPSPKVCDFGTLQCVLPAAKQLGEACQADAECQAGNFCAYSPVLTSDIVTTGGLCTMSCCTSNDCPTGFACYGAGTGGNYCVSKSDLGRPALGTAGGGAACNANADCRSGICMGGQCEDTCCNDRQCASGTRCRAMSVQGKDNATKFVFGCGAPPSGGTGRGQTCEIPGLLGLGNYPPCTEGVCDANGTTCQAPCCSSSSCSSSCGNTTAYHHGDIVTACSGNGNKPGTKQLGQSCNTASDCAGNRCLQDASGAKYCSDACCIDADCAGAGLVCRPYDSGSNHYYLRCQRPPTAAATAAP